MPTFAIINPTRKSIRSFDCPTYLDAIREAGLAPGELNFGTIGSWPDGSTANIVVYELGLLKGSKADPNGFFAFNGRLYNGPAVLFKADPDGSTTDLSEAQIQHWETECEHVAWLGDSRAAERAIKAGTVERPKIVINGALSWQWTPDSSRS